MARYTSIYKGLRFTAEGRSYRFTKGTFSTDDEKVIAALEGVEHAHIIEEAPKEEEKPKRKPKPKAEEAAE